MAINAKMANNKINAFIGGDTPEEAATTHAVYFKGDPGPAGPQGPQGIPGVDGQDGADGKAATIAVGTVTTGAPNDPAAVTNVGTSDDAIFNFTIPKGDKGDTGNTGQAATIAVGTVTTVDPTDPATVTNSGTSSAAVFNFEIPKGDKGDTGPAGTTDYNDLENKPSIPSTAADVGALPDDTKYAASNSAGGAAELTVAIPYGEVDSTSTNTAYTVTVPGIHELKDGVVCYIRNDVVTSTTNFTLNVNGLGAKPVYQNSADATRIASTFSSAVTWLFIYNENRVAGGCWDAYYGYVNSNTIGYQVRTNSTTLPVSDKCYRYRLLFTSADGTKFVPANADTQTSAAKVHTTCTTPIDPFGSIFYYGTTTALSAGGTPSKTIIWQQYVITLGYSFNNANAALTLTANTPVYITATPQSDGSAVLDYFTQTLPSSEDGKIYIFLGVAIDATTVEMQIEHPIYWYKDGEVRQWTNAVGGGSGVVNTWYATCSTATGTAAKEATSSSGDFVLATGNMVRVKFANTNNQLQPTLSVDGSTAARIKNLPSDSDINTQWWRAGEVIDLVYDGTDFIISDGGQASTGYYGKTILSNSTSSTSQTTAATSKAVKDAYDLADSKVSVPAGGSTGQALLKVSNTDHDVAWGSVPSGTMYYPNQTVSVANNAEMLRITDVAITTQTVVTEVTFDGPVTVTSWTSYDGYFAIYGTCTTATTANVTLSNVDTPSPNVPLAIANGGTDANTAEEAASNLGFDEGSDYIKFPNGTLIQWGSFSVGPVDVATSWGQLFESPGISVNEIFSEAFYSAPQITYRCRAGGAQVLLEDATYVSTTGITGTVYLYRPTASLAATATISWIAIGRWKA